MPSALVNCFHVNFVVHMTTISHKSYSLSYVLNMYDTRRSRANPIVRYDLLHICGKRQTTQLSRPKVFCVIHYMIEYLINPHSFTTRR